MTQACENCRFFGPCIEEWKWTDASFADKGRCRRYAPSASNFPQEVRKSDWCGEYEPAGSGWTVTVPLPEPTT
jgi:hypothetical protein